MSRPIRKDAWMYLLLSLALWTYLWLRAFMVPAAFDEAATFFYYVHSGRFLPFLSHWDVNNHFLNSLLSWISYKLFGPSLPVLRLPNLLMAPVLFYFTYRLSTLMKNPYLGIGFFIVICFTHSFIEFFGISRGYGISMAFLSGSVWYLFRLVGDRNTRNYILPLLFMTLAVYANFTLINSFIILLVIVAVMLITDSSPVHSKVQKSLILLVFGIIPLAFSSLIVFALKEHGNLWAGSPDGFFKVTIGSLLLMLTNLHYSVTSWFAAMYTILILLLTILLWLRFRNTKPFPLIPFLFVALFFGNILATILLNKILHINYPEDRLVLYLFLFFTASVFFLLDLYADGVRKWLILLPVLPMLWFPLEFLQRMNLQYHTLYMSDNLPTQFYDRIYSAYVPGNFPPVIGGEHGRHFTWAYLDYRHGGRLGEIVYSDFPGNIADFQVADIHNLPRWEQWYDTLDHDPFGERYLLARKHPLLRVPLAFTGGIANDKFQSGDFNTIFECRTDTLCGRNLAAGLDLRIEAAEEPFKAWIVAVVTDSAGNALRYERYPLDWHRRSWNLTDEPLKYLFILHHIPSDAIRLSIYFWNMDKTPYRYSNGSVTLYRLDEPATSSTHRE